MIILQRAPVKNRVKDKMAGRESYSEPVMGLATDWPGRMTCRRMKIKFNTDAKLISNRVKLMKKRMNYLAILISGILMLAGTGQLFAQQYDVQKIVKSIDELYRTESSNATMEMKITTPHWQRTLKMNTWTKGTDKTFIRITEPKKEQGTATLRIGNEMWNYLPRTNKVMKIPPSMMMGSWMGSDFTNDDLVNEFSLLDDYTHELIHPDSAKSEYLYIKAVPKPDLPIVWGRQIIIVRKSDYIPVREEYYDEKGNLMRVLKFKDIQKFGDRRIPSIMEMIPTTKEGHKTIIRYVHAKFNVNIPDEIFTLRNLRSH